MLDRLLRSLPFARIDDAARARLYKLTGGLPLAVQLVVRQLGRDADSTVSKVLDTLEGSGDLGKEIYAGCIARLAPRAQRVLRCLAHFEADDLPEGLLKSVVTEVLGETHADAAGEFRKIRMRLLNSGLLQPQGHTAYRMHRLVQGSALGGRDGGREATDAENMQHAARAICSTWNAKYDKYQISTWAYADQLIPHVQCFARRCLARAGALSLDVVRAMVGGSVEGLLFQGGFHLSEHRHSLNAAEAMMRNCQRIVEGAVGLSARDKSLGLAVVEHGLGMVQVYLCHNDNAALYFAKALEKRRSILGENHRVLADTYNHMGNVFYNKGDYDAALEHYKKALDIELPVLGEKHPSVATTYSNMGNVFYNKGDYDAALDHYKKALDIQLAVLGEKHPSVATTYGCCLLYTSPSPRD